MDLVLERARIGERLREVRIETGLSLDEAAARTHIPAHYLTAIEDGDAAGLPATTYGAAFVKAYARMLGLDDNAAAHAFRHGIKRPVAPREHVEPAPAVAAEAPPASRARGLWPVVAAVLLLAIGFGAWRLLAPLNDNGPVPAVPPLPAPRPIAAPPEARAKPVQRRPARPGAEDRKSNDLPEHGERKVAPSLDHAPRPQIKVQSKASPTPVPKARAASSPAPATSPPDRAPATAPRVVTPATPIPKVADAPPPTAPAAAPPPVATPTAPPPATTAPPGA